MRTDARKYQHFGLHEGGIWDVSAQLSLDVLSQKDSMLCLAEQAAQKSSIHTRSITKRERALKYLLNVQKKSERLTVVVETDRLFVEQLRPTEPHQTLLSFPVMDASPLWWFRVFYSETRSQQSFCPHFFFTYSTGLLVIPCQISSNFSAGDYSKRTSN